MINREIAEQISDSVAAIIITTLQQDDTDPLSIFYGLLVTILAFQSTAPQDCLPPTFVKVYNAVAECLNDMQSEMPNSSNGH